MPVSYAARAKKMPEEPAIRVLSRSKNAAPRGGPAPLLPSVPSATSCPSWQSSEPSDAPLGTLDLEDHRVALAAARADCRTAKPTDAPAQLEHESAKDACAGGADRVAEGHGAAVHVDSVLIDVEHADRVERHRRE